MADLTVRAGHVVSRVVVGLAYVVAGLLVLIAQVQDVRLQWSVVGPVALVLLGVGLLVTALVDTHLLGGRRVPRT
jgi:hypothetical protein